jgi:hypothetical protein
MTFEQESMARAERHATAIGGSLIVSKGYVKVRECDARADSEGEVVVELDSDQATVDRRAARAQYGRGIKQALDGSKPIRVGEKERLRTSTWSSAI